MQIGVIVISDSTYKGTRKDESGKEIIDIMKNNFSVENVNYTVVPDEEDAISNEIARLVKIETDIVITTGGTGPSERDRTPEATMRLLDKRLYGMEILMLMAGLKRTDFAALSRAVVGVAKRTLIINLPGNKYAVRENLSALLHIIPHTIEEIKGKKKELPREDIQ